MSVYCYRWSHEIQVFGLFLRTCLDTDEEDVITQVIYMLIKGVTSLLHYYSMSCFLSLGCRR